MIFKNFKLGKLNHIAIATRDAKSHLNFFGNVLKAEIGDKLVIKHYKITKYYLSFIVLVYAYVATTRTRCLHNFR